MFQMTCPRWVIICVFHVCLSDNMCISCLPSVVPVYWDPRGLASFWLAKWGKRMKITQCKRNRLSKCHMRWFRCSRWQQRKGWKQLKIIFKGEDCCALQSLVDDGTITPNAQRTAKAMYNAIPSIIKEEEPFWHYRHEIVSDLHQKLDDHKHTLSNHISEHITISKFSNINAKETLNLILLQQKVQCQEARNWIWQQDQATLAYVSLLAQCATLESRWNNIKKLQKRPYGAHHHHSSYSHCFTYVSGCYQCTGKQMWQVWILTQLGQCKVVRSTTIVEVRYISLVSAGNHTSTAKMTKTGKITKVPRRTVDGQEAILADSCSRSNTEAGKMTKNQDKQPLQRPQAIFKIWVQKS